jgi:LuxR family maltose regulon positive regulatory protein
VAAYAPSAFVLAIDDFHHLAEAQPELVEALGSLLDKLPPRQHVLLAARTRLPFATQRLQARGKLVVFGPDRLRFTPEQAVGLVLRRAPGSQPDARELARLEGWPLGLDLFTRGFAGLGRAQAGTQELAEYMLEELVMTRPRPLRAFMTRAALLAEPGVEACAEVLPEPNAARHLEALAEAWLVERMPEQGLFRFPGYLLEFLRTRARLELEPEELAALHSRAAAFYSKAERPALAFAHAIAAQDWPTALAACEASFPRMRFEGRARQIAQWLAQFPPELRQTEPALCLWHGNELADEGRHPEAALAYEQARKLYIEREDEPGELAALVKACNVALTLGEDRPFGRLAMQAQARLAGGRGADVADFYLIRAFAGEARGDMALMRECNEAVLAIPIAGDVDIASSACLALMNLATLALHRGELDRSERNLARMDEIAAEWGFTPLRLIGAFLQANLALTVGDVERASEHLRDLPDGWEPLLHWADLGVAHTVLGHLAQHKGEWVAAEAALTRALGVYERADFVEGRKVPLERLGWLAIQRRQPARVETLVGGELPPDPRNVYDLALALPVARARQLSGDAAGAVALLSRAVPELERLEARLLLARARLLEAAARLATGDASGAATAYAAALAAIEAGGYQFLLAHDQALWQDLAPLTSGKARGTGTAPLGAARGAGTKPLPARRAAGTAPLDESLLPETPMVVTDAPRSMELRVFGVCEIRIGGMLIDQWPRRRAKLVLAALALEPNGIEGPVLAERLGLEGAEGSGALRVAFFALRHALEPDLGKRDTSRYVQLRGERYQLAWETVSGFDLRTFDRELTKGEAARKHTPAEAAAHMHAALELYRGHLLDEGLFLPFFEAERESARRRALEAFLWTAGYHTESHDARRAEELLYKASGLFPHEEEIPMALMRHFHGLGRGDRVRELYWDFRKALKAGLGSAPGAGFEALYRELGSGGARR